MRRDCHRVLEFRDYDWDGMILESCASATSPGFQAVADGPGRSKARSWLSKLATERFL